MSSYGHTRATGDETTRKWKAPGGVDVVAVRDRDRDNWWRIEQGPPNLIGRHFHHIRDARIAVKQAPHD